MGPEYSIFSLYPQSYAASLNCPIPKEISLIYDDALQQKCHQKGRVARTRRAYQPSVVWRA